jgi:hypothetical protein
MSAKMGYIKLINLAQSMNIARMSNALVYYVTCRQSFNALVSFDKVPHAYHSINVDLWQTIDEI